MKIRFSKRELREILILGGSLLAICLVSLLSCTTGSIQSVQSTKPKTELTLHGWLDGREFTGIAIGSSAKTHEIIVESPVDINYFTIKTCHRSDKVQDFITFNPLFKWLTPKRRAQWMYNQSPGIEDDGNCIARFCAFSSEVGSSPVTCGAVDFHNDKFQLPATNICNGASGSAVGTALCHTQIGLIERIKFESTVMIAPQSNQDPKTGGECDPLNNSNCQPSKIHDQCEGRFLDEAHTLFEYLVPNKECVIEFMEMAKPYRRGKLTVIPYDIPQYVGGPK